MSGTKDDTKAGAKRGKRNNEHLSVVIPRIASGTRKKPVAKRARPSVTSRSMQVRFPGKNPSSRQATKAGSSQKGKTNRRSASASSSRSSSAKRTSASRTAASSPRRVVPPKIGQRKGYRPSVAARLLPFVLIIALALCIAVILWYLVLPRLASHGTATEEKIATAPSPVGQGAVSIVIRAGMSAGDVADLLEREGVTGDGTSLLAYFVDHGLDSLLRSGTYMMDRPLSDSSIASILVPSAATETVMVPSAYTLKAVDAYLANRGYAEPGSFLDACDRIRDERGLSFCEGWFLAGTYRVPTASCAEDLARAMYGRMLETVQPLAGSDPVGRWGLDAVLIVASMIQAETQALSEMPYIASVIYNRLEAGQPLGIDATTRYELDNWTDPIPQAALEKQTPYNTRRKKGLPPSGICCPSRQAVEAACRPAESEYFYYLHGRDGSFHPARTYDEHLEHIKDYR